MLAGKKLYLIAKGLWKRKRRDSFESSFTRVKIRNLRVVVFINSFLLIFHSEITDGLFKNIYKIYWTNHFENENFLRFQLNSKLVSESLEQPSR